MNIIKKCLVVVLVFSTILILQLPVHADDGVIGRTPEGVYPMKDAEVEMESENIIVDIEKFTVECTFVFHNTGDARDVLMGFPGKLREDLGSDFSDDVSLTLNEFKTFVKDKELPVKREKGVQSDINLPNYSEWFTFTVPFKNEERITVRNTYSFEPSYDSSGYVYTGYVLQTGATWKGRIGKARVEFKLGSIQPWQIERLRPGGFRFEGNSIIWERQDIEPSYDLNLDYNTWHYSSDFLDSLDFNNEEKDRSLFKIEKYKEIKKLAEKSENESLLSEYKKAVEARDTVLAVYVASLLKMVQIPDNVPALGDISITQDAAAYRIDCDIISLYAADILLQVSHMEDEKAVTDLESDTSSCYITLTPGVEYDISIAVTDWLDRIEKKEIKYKVPEASDRIDDATINSIDAALGNSAVGTHDITGLSSPIPDDSANEDLGDMDVDSMGKGQSPNGQRYVEPYIWIPSGTYK